METIHWRGTWGVGDFMWALNVAHHWQKFYDPQVKLVMHWPHLEDHRETPKDPETIIERFNWLHKRYWVDKPISVEHEYQSQLFDRNSMSGDKKKKRYYFESGYWHNAPPQEWLFAPEELRKSRNDIKEKKIVYWTPTHNSATPRKWKRLLTNDDWCDIIKALSGEGWDCIELTYRTPVEVAYNQIRNARLVLCYDGMWHKIARNFCKPMIIPSKQSVTRYNTPTAIRATTKEEFYRLIENLDIEFAETRANNQLREMARVLNYDF